MLIETLTNLRDLKKALADCLEIRLDLMPLPNLKTIQSPYLLTPRNKDVAFIEKLLKLAPPYMDLSIDLDPGFIEKTIRENRCTKFILSYHNFDSMPKDLEEIYTRMKQFGAYAYKIAVYTASSIEALKLLLFKKNHPDLSVIAMGENGQFARILAPIFGNHLNYASIGSKTAALGQISSQTMLKEYRFQTLNQETAIFGLIGDPISHSIGHLYHNKVFKQKKKNAIYIKIKITPDELPCFFKLIKILPFKGLSVTMPLKEKILPYLDEIDPKAKAIGAVNTLSIQNGAIYGTNTDGVAAINAIEKRCAVKDKQILILGAGGAARAIAYEASLRKASIWIHNRTKETAEKLGYPVGIPPHYDVVINCAKEPLPISFSTKPLVMDINYNKKENPFLEDAKACGCQTIDGKEMFFGQAALQSELWLCRSQFKN